MMDEEKSAVVAEIIMNPANGPSVTYHIGKRIATSDDAQNYWEVAVIQPMKVEPHLVHFGAAGVDLEGKGWGIAIIFSGDYSISFEQNRVLELDMDEEALAAATL